MNGKRELLILVAIILGPVMYIGSVGPVGKYYNVEYAIYPDDLEFYRPLSQGAANSTALHSFLSGYCGLFGFSFRLVDDVESGSFWFLEGEETVHGKLYSD